MAVIPANQYPLMAVYFRDSLRKEYNMTNTVYIVTRPIENKFGWTPDLTDAARYGIFKIIFEPEDKPQFNPTKSIETARKVMQGFTPDDFLLWPGGGDPIAVMIACMVAAEESEEVNILRWERNFDEIRDRRKGWYLPVKLNMA
jgi:hypothetical protein|tara:strand:- start:78 stop:509 length:432 start_codon:yes stop_codon:yes gene_type:complete